MIAERVSRAMKIVDLIARHIEVKDVNQEVAKTRAKPKIVGLSNLKRQEVLVLNCSCSVLWVLNWCETTHCAVTNYLSGLCPSAQGRTHPDPFLTIILTLARPSCLRLNLSVNRFPTRYEFEVPSSGHSTNSLELTPYSDLLESLETRGIDQGLGNVYISIDGLYEPFILNLANYYSGDSGGIVTLPLRSSRSISLDRFNPYRLREIVTSW